MGNPPNPRLKNELVYTKEKQLFAKDGLQKGEDWTRDGHFWAGFSDQGEVITCEIAQSVFAQPERKKRKTLSSLARRSHLVCALP
jgi:hypothetical protein